MCFHIDLREPAQYTLAQTIRQSAARSECFA